MSNILKVAVIVLVLGVAGCAHPRHESHMVPLSRHPSTSAGQADAICRQQAQMSATRPRGYDAAYERCLAQYGWRVERY